MKITSETKIFMGIIGFTLLIIIGAILIFSKPAPVYSKDQLITENTYIRGSQTASLYLVEFSDFECPSCKAFHVVVNKVLEKYSDQLLFAYRHYPLKQHSISYKAALSAQAAGKQNKFWEMHDFLFDNQENLSEAVILQGASSIGLNLNQYTNDLKDPSVSDAVSRDISDGTKFGISATPTFFLNGKKLVLSSYDDLLKAIELSLTD